MKHHIIKVLLVIIFCLLYSSVPAEDKHLIVVSSDGTGDFKTISAAVQSLPQFNYQRIVIFVKNGTYNEKFRIEQDYITIKGENREKTIIHYSQLRSDWDENKDSIGPGVINIYGDDFILENITVENSQPQIGPHAFALYGFGTRTILANCTLKSKGADTVSLWNNKEGMYYHSNCYFEGAVDFVCPRGWCFIKDSQFYEVRKSAAIWHAGGEDINQKFVIINSSFDGVEGWELGRHHYEAQFYLINCKLSSTMSSKPIYRVTYPDEPSRDRPFNWGQRYYFFNITKTGEQFSWLKNSNNLSPDSITAEWTFGGKWDPESVKGPKIIKCLISRDRILFFLSEKVSVEGKPQIKTESGTELNYLSGAGSDTVLFSYDKLPGNRVLGIMKIINNGKIFAARASLSERNLLLIYNSPILP